MELKDLISGAQLAMDQGDYRLTIAASNHALVGYDSCLAAHRMLGEAYLERGDQQSSITHFERALAIDPLNIVSHLGLGVAAEESKRYADAYTCYLHAWESNPALDQVRDEMVRLRGLLEVGERLHPTRAALAGIHTRSGQFRRATSEWRAILAGEPENRRARTALAELLWRQGDEVGAAAAAREALRGTPENARALAIMADIERRQNGSYADEFTQRFTAADPTGELLDSMRASKPDSSLDTILPDSILIDDFDFEANRSRSTGGLGRKGITASLTSSQMAAPDLWDSLVHDFSTEVPARLSPTLANAGREAATEIMMPGSTASRPGDQSHHDAFLAAISEPQPDEDAAPDDSAPDQTVSDDAEVVAAAEDQPVAALANVDSEVVPAIDLTAQAITAASNVDIDDFELDLVPFSLDEVTGDVSPASRELDQHALDETFGFADAYVDDTAPDPPPSTSHPITADDLPADEPIAVVAAEATPYVDPFVSADGRIDLTAGWDTLDQALEAATPKAEGGAGFDALMAELDVDGIVPFDAVAERPDDDAWSPFTEVDFDLATAEAPTPLADVVEVLPDATGEALESSDLEAFDVNSYVEPPSEIPLRSDLISGIPGQEPSGYTELLRSVDDYASLELEASAEVDPFANPDASGIPLAFDELIEVTSKDGTGPLPDNNETSLAAELDFTKTDLAAAMPAVDAGPIALDLDGVMPFDSSAFEDRDDESPFDFDESAQVTAAPPIAEIFQPDPDLSVLTPFAYADAPANDADAASVDFSELDIAPELVDAVVHSGTDDAADVDWSGEDVVEIAASADAIHEPVVDSWVDEPVAEVSPAEEEVAAAQLVHEPETVVASVAAPSRNGREDLTPFPTRVRWPQFVSQTSELIDRSGQTESLFARMASQKSALVEMGVVAGAKRLGANSTPPPPLAEAPPPPVVPIADPAADALAEQIRSDLMGMRIRLIEEDGSAQEIAEMLEQAVGNGLQTPLALRVLGEAYLKLGMVERAAAQFRQAMLNRRRSA